MRRRLALAGVLALGACSMAPRTRLAELPVPASWPVGDAALAPREAALPTVAFADIFTDVRLQSLVDRALANNRDIRVAAANLAAARAEVRVARADQLPEVAASATLSHDGGANGREVASTAGASLGVSAFELDLFGRLASATEAQRQGALATEAVARTVRLGLVADLAQAWVDHAYNSELLAIAAATAASASRSVTLTRARLQGGVAARTDLRQAEQVLATAQADVAAQKTALAQDLNQIRLLLGAEPDPALLPADLEPVIASIRPLPAGTSSEVLLRRPDVLAAEYRLHAADANIGSARAALFPRISLTGLLGLASDSLAGLFGGGAFHAVGGAEAAWPVFGGGDRARVAVSEAQRDGALAAYEKVIQTAFREVADALARQATIGEELRAVEARTDAAADSARLTAARYRGGVASSLENLDAQRSFYAARRSLAAERRLVAANRVALYRVLGGDQLASAGK